MGAMGDAKMSTTPKKLKRVWIGVIDVFYVGLQQTFHLLYIMYSMNVYIHTYSRNLFRRNDRITHKYHLQQRSKFKQAKAKLCIQMNRPAPFRHGAR